MEEKKTQQEELKNDSANSLVDFGHPRSVGSGMTGDSHSLGSNGYTWERQTDLEFQWKSKWQNCMFFLSLTLSWTSFTTYDREDKTFITDTPVNFLQIVVIYVLFGCPFIFLQTFLGQFTRRGCLALGSMIPIANGLGYLILLNTFFSAIFNLYTCTVLLFYVFLAAVNYSIPAWMLCKDFNQSEYGKCVGRREIDLCEPCTSPKAAAQGPCYDPDIHNLSSYLFMKTVVFKFNERSQEFLSAPDKILSVHLGIIVFILFITILRDLRDLDAPIKLWNLFIVISLTIMTIVISFTCLRFQGLLFFFKIFWKSFIDIKCWVQTIKRIIVYLNLSEGGHMLFGSFTPVTINISTRSTFLSFITFSVFTLFHMFLFILTENFLCSINAETKAISDFSGTIFILAVYPEALGSLASAPFWGTIYFFIAFGLAFQATILQILIIEMSLSQEILKPSYRLYTRSLTLIVLSLLALLFITPQGSSIVPFFDHYLNIFRVTIVFLFMIVIFIYGFQRLYDDIHFILSTPPSFFFRYSWFLCLALGGVTFFTYFFFGNCTKRTWLFYFILIILIISLMLGFMIKFVVYLMARDLSSLLSPAEVWGPKDPETRMVRRLFNPRFDVRYRRQVESCKHRCLLGSSTLKKTLDKELALISNVLLEIENNDEERKIKKDLMEELRLHRKLMSRFLAERTFGDKAIVMKQHDR